MRTEIASVFQNPNGHWQIFGTLALNAGLWAGLPVFLNWRRTGQRPSVSDRALLEFLGLTVAHYAGRYSTAAGSTEALLILAGIWVAGIWRVVGSLHPLRRFWPVLWVGIVGLAVASLWNWPLFHIYHYREAHRATGLWNNPNTYGLLSACLSAACLAWLFRIVLGHSAQQPYRIRIDAPGESDWAWVAVHSNSLHRSTLRADRNRPYDLNASPPRQPWSIIK